jgi:hypothetical protein
MANRDSNRVATGIQNKRTGEKTIKARDYFRGLELISTPLPIDAGNERNYK